MVFLINEILLEIISWLQYEDLYIFRLVNKRINSLIDPKKNTHHLEILLPYVAQYDNKKLWKLVKEWTVPDYARYYAQYAIFYKGPPDRYICTTEISMMECAIDVAVDHKNFSFCYLAKKWGHLDFSELLLEMAFEGDEKGIRLVLDLGVNNFEYMLQGGSKGGHLEICLQAQKMGAKDFESMLQGGSEYGHLEICRQARKMGAKDFRKMAESAHSNKKWDCFLLALSWGASITRFGDKIPPNLFSWEYGETDDINLVLFNGKYILWKEIK